MPRLKALIGQMQAHVSHLVKDPHENKPYGLWGIIHIQFIHLNESQKIHTYIHVFMGQRVCSVVVSFIVNNTTIFLEADAQFS